MTDHARKIVGIEALNKGADRWTGKGEIVAVIDSGLDVSHPDLAGRVKNFETVEGATATDMVGHGTHVGGTIAGSGKASKGRLRGMAPDAELIGLGVVAESGAMCLPTDLADLLRRVAKQGAKIINLSWGTALSSVYEGGSMEIDTFSREWPDVLVVVAAGNAGKAIGGYPSLYSIGTPATAKNALTVGACASDRREFAKTTWGSYAPRRFPAAPTCNQPVAGDPALTAALSSRGPTDSEAVKPDVLAPGTAILAPRASEAPQRNFWQPYPKFDNRYAFMNGTSMATPVVSGAAAVVRQYLREERGIESPSSALLRATLIAGALRVPSAREAEEERQFGYPDFDQGFGRIDVSTLLPHGAGRKQHGIDVVDVAEKDSDALESRAPAGAKHKAIHSFRVSVPAKAKEPLRFVLAWTDYSVRGTQNVLALDVQGPDGLRKRGNEDHTWLRPPANLLDPELQGLQFDSRNTIQQAIVEKPPAGEYHVRVIGQNTLFPPQGFALCVCGELAGKLEREA